MQRRPLLASTITLTALLAAGGAWAQAYPNKPVKLQVPFAPGGTTDIVARVISDAMGKALGQNVVVENKAGGGGVIGANETAKSAPDGYTLLLANSGPSVHPSFPAKDYKGFVAELKKNPGQHSYASSGTGGIGHLQMELYKNLAGVFVTHIPYRGAGPALNDTVAGQVPVIFDNMPSALPFIQANKLVAIAVAAPQRLAQLPQVPTFKEVGLEPVNRMAFYGIYGPKGLPKEVVDKVNAAVRKALEDPSVRKRIEDTGSIIIGNTPEQFAEQMKAEYAVYKQVVETAKLKLD